MSCAHCGEPICGHGDALYQGTVVIDDASEPGSWARHIRDTACMRDPLPAPKQANSGAATQHGRARIVDPGARHPLSHPAGVSRG